MATKKRAQGTRSAGRTSGAAKRRVKPAAAGSRAKKPAAQARKERAAAGRRSKAPSRAARGRSAAPASSRTAADREIALLKTRLQRQKITLERRLTEAVREIGQLRYHEARTEQLERQLQERDQIIEQLRSEVGTLRARSHERAHEPDEAQRSLSFGSRATAEAESPGSDAGFYDGDDDPA